MEKNDIFLKVRTILNENFGVEENLVTLEAKVIDDLNIDSLEIVDLTMEIEDIFGVSIPDEELENITTVSSIVEYIAKNL